ncbi:hypothetical protein [Romboutsia ilealis]|uniref:hypothetical protein n=1 Tax=Romboutsia ilealis TaxID=1115758 RepID=UPI00272C6F01|nr:hypothetical protein [Romboutsia ilealis]
MNKSEFSMFLEEIRLIGRVLDTKGIKEEFENRDYDYINKLIRDIEENKINY